MSGVIKSESDAYGSRKGEPGASLPLRRSGIFTYMVWYNYMEIYNCFEKDALNSPFVSRRLFEIIKPKDDDH